MTNPHQNYSSNIFNNKNTLKKGLIDTEKTYNTIKNIQDYSSKSIPNITPGKKEMRSVSKHSNPLTKSKKWKDVIKYLQRNPQVLMSVIPDSINLDASSIPKPKPIVDRTPMRMPRMQSDKEIFGVRKFSTNSSIMKPQSKTSSVMKSRILKSKLQHSHSPSFNSKPSYAHRNCPKWNPYWRMNREQHKNKPKEKVRRRIDPEMLRLAQIQLRKLNQTSSQESSKVSSMLDQRTLNLR